MTLCGEVNEVILSIELAALAKFSGLIMPQLRKKLKGHIALGFSVWVRACVRSFQ